MERPAWFNSALFPYESKWMEIDGATVHYVDVGEGPPLLLCHGNPTWSFLYRKIIDGLSDRFRCVAVDYPGFGLSQAAPGYGFMPHEHSEVVGEVVDRLELDGFSVMVQDWGGPIGMGVALERSERVRAFIVCNTWAWPMTGDKAAERFSKLLGSPAGEFLITRANLFLNVVMRQSFRLSKPSPEEWAMYKAPFPTPESRRPVAIMPRAILGETPWLQQLWDGIETLADRPTLILWPTKDLAFQERHRLRWEAALPNHHTVLIQGAGHYVQEEAGERLADEIRKWWPGTES